MINDTNLIVEEIVKQIGFCDYRLNEYDHFLKTDRKNMHNCLEQQIEGLFLNSSLERIRSDELLIKECNAERRALLGLMHFINEDYWKELIKKYEEYDNEAL